MLLPVIGGLICAPITFLLSLMPDTVFRLLSGAAGNIDDTLLWLLIGTIYAGAIGWPFAITAALVVHFLLRMAKVN